jgi:hypothetical protein
MASDRAYLAQCLAKMHMAPALVDQIPAVLRGEASFTPAAGPADEGAHAANRRGCARVAHGVRPGAIGTFSY